VALGLSRVTTLALAALTCGSLAHAEGAPEHTLRWNPHPETPSADTAAEKSGRNAGAAQALDDEQLAPFTIGAPVPRATAAVKTLGGFDSTTTSARARTSAEAGIGNFLALRLEYEHGPGTGSNDRVTVGGRVTFLHEEKHGIDGGAGFFYDAKDFRNEGNFIGALMVGRHFGKLALYANALFGMDSEGDDASVEGRVGTGYRLTPAFQIGFDTRARFNMSSDQKRADARAVNWELQTGPTAAFSVGPIALLAMVGPSLLRVTDPGERARLNSGVLALGGAGAAF